MANPLFVVDAVAAGNVPVSVEVRAILPEVALKRGKEQLTIAHGKVRKATVRYAASAFRMDGDDFIDPNRAPGDGSDD